MNRLGQRAWQEAGRQLRPLLRLTVHAGAGPAVVVRLPFLPHLFAYVAVQERAGMRLVRPEEAAHWGATFAELLGQALENLASRDDHLELYPTSATAPVLSVGADDELQSSRLLQPGWLGGFAALVEGRPVCAVPSWGTCLVTGDASQTALEQLFELAERQFLDNPEAVSPVLYTVDEESLVVPLCLPEGHPLAPRIARSEALLLARAYEEQRDALELAVEEQGATLRVAECRLLPHADGRLLTAATHVRGVEALLPATDLLVLAWDQGDGSDFLLVWTADLLALAPHVLLRQNEHDPSRYAAVGFPGEIELQALRIRALASSDHEG